MYKVGVINRCDFMYFEDEVGLSSKHVSVLLNETLESLDIQPNDIVIDGTLGLGGHAKEIAKKLDGGRLYGFDLDKRNIQRARQNLKKFEGKVAFINDGFDRIDHYSKVMKLENIDKVLLDLGLSSPHLDNAEYGFSYKSNGPLDMRFNQGGNVTAAMVLNNLSHERLVELFRNYGEIQGAPKLASIILEEREKAPFKYTVDFVERIEGFLHPQSRSKVLACIFQALRIAVNDELNRLYKGLRRMFELMSPGGRMAVISYHSLEDRIVKQYFNSLLKPEPKNNEESLKSIHGEPLVKLVNKKPIVPSEKEIEENPRSRSAKMRVIEKL